MDNNIHNWYEQVVMHKLGNIAGLDTSLSEELWSDVACVALNHLPARYVRHTVDVSFYTSQQERHEMEARIDVAIENAIDFVTNHPNADHLYKS